MTVVGLALLPGSAVSQQKSLKDQLVGVWTLVSVDNVAPDGTRRQNFGPNPQGILILDAGGRYAQINVRPDRPKFKSNSRLQGTPEEIKAAWDGSIAHFGTWSVSEADKTLVLRIQNGAYPNQAGAEQKRTVASLSGDELKYVNPSAAAGGRAEAVWRRVK
jgi:hypothetical protein